MAQANKQSMFSGLELDKLKEFCKQCAEEDRRIHKEGYIPPPEPAKTVETQKTIKQEQKAISPPVINNNQNQNKDNYLRRPSNSEFTNVRVLKPNDPDPLNARISSNTFNERLAQFGNKK